MLLTGNWVCKWPVSVCLQWGVRTVQNRKQGQRSADRFLRGIWPSKLRQGTGHSWSEQALDEQQLLHSGIMFLPHVAIPLVSQLVQERILLSHCQEGHSKPHVFWADTTKWSPSTHRYFQCGRASSSGSGATHWDTSYSSTTIWGMSWSVQSSPA